MTLRARSHTFTLEAPGWVTVDLQSDPSESPRLDTYLVLSGGSLARSIKNDDDRDPNGYYYDSRIGPRLLPAGTYVAEATAFGIGRTGGFTLTAACPTVPVLPGGPSLATSTHNGVLCIRAGTTPTRRPKRTRARGASIIGTK